MTPLLIATYAKSRIDSWLGNLIRSYVDPWGSLLSAEELHELIDIGIIDAPHSAVNGSSIDITLHHIIRKERMGSTMKKVRLWAGESIETDEVDMSITGTYMVMPDAAILGANNEKLNMPLWLSAEYSLKSTLGRNFLNHQLAGWIDPGFTGALTLELKNDTQFAKHEVAPGMKIGQIKFFRHKSVPPEYSYANRGQYNGQRKVTPAGVLR
jgi:dCTP deaminase